MKIKKNPDAEFVAEFTKKLKNNSGYCPCRLTKTKETKCMCSDFKQQVERGEAGYCHCGLYYAENN